MIADLRGRLIQKSSSSQMLASVTLSRDLNVAQSFNNSYNDPSRRGFPCGIQNRSVMETQLSHLHISERDARGLAIGSLQVKMMHFVWTKAEYQYLFKLFKEKTIKCKSKTKCISCIVLTRITAYALRIIK